MPESTVAQSIVGALGSIAGISGRRAQDGLVGAQAEEVALKNKATKKLIQDDEDASLIGELQHLGYLSIDPATGKANVDAPRLAKENPEAFSRLMGPEANRFLSTGTPNGPQSVQFAGIKALDPRVAADPSLGAYPQELGPQTGPSKYVVQLRMGDGSIKPATRNASAAPDDTLITLDDDALNSMVAGRIGRMAARGGLDNNVTMTNLKLDFIEESDRLLQSKLADMGTEGLTDDPSASRGFYGILNELTGADLDEAVRDRGLDPDKLRAEAQTQWLEKQKGEREAIDIKNMKTMDQYVAAREAFDRNAASAAQALADYDKQKGGTPPGAPKNNAEKMLNNMALGSTMAMGGTAGADSARKIAPKGDPVRDKLVKNLNEANQSAMKLKPPKLAAAQNQPPFEWNEDKLREMVSGKIGGEPSAEQTSAMTKYAKDNGVKTAQDLGKLPDKNHAMALAGIIAMNARGASPEQKMAIFDKLANYARTGDSSKSPLGAKLDIIGAQNDQAQVINQGRAVDASINNSIRDYNADMAKVGVDVATLENRIDEQRWGKSKDVDAANNVIRGYVDTIYKGTLGDGNKIQPPTPEAMTAWKDLRSSIYDLPEGSPQQIAARGAFVEGFFQMAAAQSAAGNAADWFDVPKHLANIFFRPDGKVNMSPLIETATFQYGNGGITEVRFKVHGATGNDSKLVINADRFKELTGSSDFKLFVDSVHSQQAANMLQGVGKPATPNNIASVVKGLRTATGMDKE